MSVIHFLFLRHGQTDANAQGILQGQSPTSLNARGREQADRLAARLAHFVPPVDRLVSSDLPRALETAEPIARALGLNIDIDRAWRERGFGALEGQTIGELDIWRAASGSVDPPGAEGLSALDDRVWCAMAALLDAARDRAVVAVVTHGGVIRAILRMLASGRLPLADHQPAPPQAPIANASILHLTIDRQSERWAVRRANDIDHLEAVTTSDFG